MTRTNENQDESPGHPDTPIGVCPGLSGFVEFALSVKVRICPAVRVGCPGCFSYQTAAIVTSRQDCPLKQLRNVAQLDEAKIKVQDCTLITSEQRAAASGVSKVDNLVHFPAARSAEVAKVQSCTVAVLCFPTICAVISGASDCDDTKPRRLQKVLGKKKQMGVMRTPV